MKDLNFALKKLCDRNRDGSFGTQANRKQQLNQIANDLDKMGYRHLKSADGLKEKHVWALVEKWKQEKISAGGMKNRMATIRWVAEKTGNTLVGQKTNTQYGIADRQYVTNKDKSLKFPDKTLAKIPSEHVQASARLQREFGLRREEAMKIVPSRADQGDKLHLESSWCKGGKSRIIPIETDSQRAALEYAHAIADKGSLIPNNKNYAQHMRIFEKQMGAVGLGRSHGARHGYAQKRYKDLVGRRCPAQGVKTVKSRKEEIREARLQISQELGHEREQITAVYLGR